MLDLRPSISSDLPRVMDIWRAAVDATHDFLAPGDRDAIEAELLEFLPQVSLLLAVDSSDAPIGFMLSHDGHLEALFVDPAHHGKGVGKALVHNVLAAHPGLTVDVNEQNLMALGFYEHLGFDRVGRPALDGQGRPYPLIHLRRRVDR